MLLEDIKGYEDRLNKLGLPEDITSEIHNTCDKVYELV